MAAQEEELKVTEARVEALKLTVAGVANSTETNTPTGSWASTSGTRIKFTEAFEKALVNMRLTPDQAINT